MELGDFGSLSSALGEIDPTFADRMGEAGSLKIGNDVGDNLASELSNLASDNADKIKGMDDTWFTPDRVKKMQEMAKSEDFSAPGLNLPQGGQMPVAAAQHPSVQPAQLPAMQPMQNMQLSPLQHGAVQHGALGAPLQHFRSGGALHPMHLKSFAGGGAMMPRMMASLHSIRQRLSNVQPQVKRAVPIGQQHGPGTGRSDSIHSAFADGGKVATGDGEYVIPADTVSFLGEGSSDAGARVLDAFVEHTRGLHRKALGALPPPRKG